jgi:hypothetical protein
MMKRIVSNHWVEIIIITLILLVGGIVAAEVMQGQTSGGVKKTVLVESDGTVDVKLTTGFGTTAATPSYVAPGTSAIFPVSADTSANTVTHQMFMQPTNGTNGQDILAASSDNVAWTNNPAMTYCVMAASDGTASDMVKLGASGELQVTDVATRPGEDASSGTVKGTKMYSNGYHPPKTTTADILGTLKTVLASVEILDYPNCTVWVRNLDAAKAFTDFAVFGSPDNSGTCGDANWVSIASTACDTLAATLTCAQVITPNSYRYLCAQAKCAASTDDCDSVDAWVTCNPG